MRMPQVSRSWSSVNDTPTLANTSSSTWRQTGSVSMSTPSMSKTHALDVLPMALMLLAWTRRNDHRRSVRLIVGTRCGDAGGLGRFLPVMHAEDRSHDDHHVEQGFASVRLPPGDRARVHVEPQEG